MSRVAPALKLAGLMVLIGLAGCGSGRRLQPAPDINPGPSRTHPTPGTENPTAPGPQGALPDPYVHPGVGAR